MPPRAAAASAEPSTDLEKLMEYASTVPKMNFAEECRTLVELGRSGVLSTMSASSPGFPAGAVVGYAADGEGRPILALSSLSGHTRDLASETRCSLTVMAQGFAGAADARVSLMGRCTPVPEAEVAAAREVYLAKHPDAFWVDFGDFSWHRFEASFEDIRLVGGFARAATVKTEDYAAAEADPVAAFSGPVASHMNADHSDSTVACVLAATGVAVSSASIVSLDKIGLNIEAVTADGEQTKLRLPFPEPATDRKAVKDQIVAMTKAAAAKSE
eukprot:CAMPEP_0170143258 /NCGR_PEP_ID=MMETSP0033_2-20121228/9812_1 /TAXON_ID=195969 /ORGANISM="Dolichomastix tenuilepis, Strain CCMP3274" /LENGTH=271 /DNA_ID=CAMNT_0010379691 /DNA_START=77 /DNA_END=892 /DNA_ORIENTATION=+